jgi:foldase protein PrsA
MYLFRRASELTGGVRRCRPWRLLGAWLLLWCLPSACGPQGEIIVRVNGEIITQGELLAELHRREGARLLLEMADTLLIEQAAAQQKLAVSDQELGLKYEQAVARLGSEGDLQRRLPQLGLSMDEFRRAVRAEALLDRLAMARLEITEEDVRQYYEAHAVQYSHGEQVRIRLMLFAGRENAEVVLAALKEPGADFAGLAAAFSEDPATREQGGDTGFFERSAYVKPLSDAAFALPPGQRSELIEVPDGWALLEMLERRPAGRVPLEQVQAGIRSRLQLELLDQARLDWLRRTRLTARLEVPDPVLAAGLQRLIEADTPYEAAELNPDLPRAPR